MITACKFFGKIYGVNKASIDKLQKVQNTVVYRLDEKGHFTLYLETLFSFHVIFPSNITSHFEDHQFFIKVIFHEVKQCDSCKEVISLLNLFQKGIIGGAPG